MARKNEIMNNLISKAETGKKSIGVLIDPDKVDSERSLQKILNICVENRIDYFLVGGSLITTNNIGAVVGEMKACSDIPVLLFPGSNMYLDFSADAILFLSLISGRNPELLIGQHVVAAPILKRSNIEVIPTGYMLIGNKNDTTASYMSNTIPIPASKPPVAVCTAIAGEMLGLRSIYLDAGSGAMQPVPEKMIKMVSKSIELPLIVGGGLNTTDKALRALQAGADMVVLGNGIEENPGLLIEVTSEIGILNESLNVHQ